MKDYIEEKIKSFGSLETFEKFIKLFFDYSQPTLNVIEYFVSDKTFIKDASYLLESDLDVVSSVFKDFFSENDEFSDDVISYSEIDGKLSEIFNIYIEEEHYE